jgi:glycosyltransferase involved in cell wall biosynthesis
LAARALNPSFELLRIAQYRPPNPNKKTAANTMSDESVKLSVLMPVYYADVPDQLDTAIRSVIDQTLPPDEIVIVKDGPLGAKLDAVIEKWTGKHPGLFLIISLDKNQGLGPALQAGIEKCSNEIVARMDADDISCSDRFEKLLLFLSKNPEITLVSSWMGCFENNPDNVLFVRRAPTTHEKIRKLAGFRNPINHAPSVFRRSAVLGVGGYKHRPGFEDIIYSRE